MGNLDRWTVFRLSWHFGFAQFGMPIVGWYAGGFISGWVGSLGHWLAALIFFAIGSHAIYEQLRPEQREWKRNPTRGATLIVLMFATSIDALAAGLSLALVGTDILNPALIIGVVAAGMTVLGLSFGRALGLRFSRQAGILGGLILIALAVKTVW